MSYLEGTTVCIGGSAVVFTGVSSTEDFEFFIWMENRCGESSADPNDCSFSNQHVGF